jgi:hypothetical protein
MGNIKISQLTPKGANLESTDLLEISEFDGSGYVTRSITGQEIIDAAAGGGAVTDITVNAPLATTGGTTPDLSISEADASTDGYLTANDWLTFNGKQANLISGFNIKTINSFSVLGSGGINVQDTLVSGTNIKTINGSSVLGSGDLVVSATANPSVISLSATNGTAVTGTLSNTITSSILVPANTFSSNGIIEITGRFQKTGVLGSHTLRLYTNTSASLTGATLVANIFSGTNTNVGAFRNANIFSNTINFMSTNITSPSDYTSITGATTTATFNTSLDNYLIFTIQLSNISDSSVLQYHRVIKYI